jgi:hypothetical protein
LKKILRALIYRRRFTALSTLINAVWWKFAVASAPLSNALAELFIVSVFLAKSTVLALDDAVGNLCVAVRAKIVGLASVAAIVVDAITLGTNNRMNAALAVVLAETFALVNFAVNASETVKAVASIAIQSSGFSTSSTVEALNRRAVFTF